MLITKCTLIIEVNDDKEQHKQTDYGELILSDY